MSHVYALGPPIVDIESYLKPKVDKLVMIGFPFSYSKIEKSFFVRFVNGKEVSKRELRAFIRRDWYLYVRDFCLGSMWGFAAGKSDVFIGINNLNALVGLILRAMRRTKVVVYYTIDYNPTRFSNPILNNIYHGIDSYCVKHADYVWNLSSLMADEREKKGIAKKFRAKQLTVPIGVNRLTKPKNLKAMHRNEIAYMGHLRHGQGVELLINAFPGIVKRVPQATLAIIGGGELLDQLKQRVADLGLVNKVYFSGFIKSHSDLEERLSFAQIAVAPYEDTPGNYTRYTDPGKPKLYLSLGLPVIITKVPQFAYIIERRQAGEAIDYDQKQLIRAATELLLDQKKWHTYHLNAIKLSQEYAWDTVFDKAFNQMV